MFLLSYSTLGGDGIFSDAPPAAEGYTYVEVRGNCIVDGVHGLDYEMDDADLSDLSGVEDVFCMGDPIVNYLMYTSDYLNNYAYEPVYGDGSILAANFESNLEAGSLISGISIPINKYIIRRKVSGESLNPTLIELAYDRDLYTYVDYTAKNYISYTYGVYPLYEDETDRFEGTGVEGDGELAFFGYILSDTASTPVTSYLFSVELETGEFKANKGFKVYENHTKFPAYRANARNYLSGSLSTIPLDDNLEVSETLLQEIIDFINNDTEKILRCPSGRILRVVTMNASIKYMDRLAEQPATLKFDFIEIAEVV